MARPYTVFVSSTYLDNVTRRKLVEEAVINADMVPVGMERFTASTRPTVEECVRLCHDSDVLLGIIARRYGWIPAGGDRSITEIEYGAARDRLMFIIDDSAPVDSTTDYDVDDRDAKAALLARFKERIPRDQMPARFTDGTLQLKVYRALIAWREFKEKPQSPAAEAVDAPPIYEGPLATRHSYRYEIAGFTRFYAEPFVDRDKVLREITGFVSQREGGYFIVLAPAGYGKTALFVRLLGVLAPLDASGPRVDTVCFFARGEHGSEAVSDFFPAANSQLLDLLNLRGGVPPEVGAQRAQFGQLWRRAAERATKERPLLLLVDGLDEPCATATSLAQLLPATLGPYVNVICSSQPFPDPRQSVAIDHPLRTAVTRRLSELQESDIAQVLTSAGLEEPQVRSLAGRVLELTNGMPLYSRFVCAEVAEHGADALDRLQREPPAGVREYFAQALEQLVAHSGGTGVAEALGLLLVARGPIRLEELSDALGRPLLELRKSFVPVRRFTVGEERLRLMHPELARAMESMFSPAERRDLRKCLLRWCASYADRGWPQDTPEYVIEQYAGHLYDDGDFDALDRLLDSRWASRQREAFGSYAPLIRGLGYALEAAAASHPSHLGREFCSYIMLGLTASVSGRTPSAAVSALAHAGHLSRARTYAELTMYPYDRAVAYIALAEALAAGNQTTDARAALVTALDAIGSLETYVLFDILRDLSLAGARLGERGILSRAWELARQHPRNDLKTGALCGVALGFAILAEGKSTAANIARSALHESADGMSGSDASDALTSICEVAAACGDEGLISEVRDHVNSWRGALKSDVLAACALMYSRLRFDREAESYARRAVRAARALRDLPRRAQSLARCSEILGAVPQLATVAKATVVTALAAARAIPVDDASDSSTEATVGVVVERYAALATAEELEVLYAELGEWRRRWPSVTALLAVGLARAGSVPRALRVLDEVSADRRETTLHDIGCKLVEQERLDDARELTKRIESAWARADILARAAQEYAKLGRSAVAAEVALLAISVSETIAPGAGSVAMAVGIGTALRDVGDMDGGRRIAGEALRTLLPLNPYNAIYVDLAPAVDALIEADAFEDAYDLATIVGALAGYMVDQTPGLSEQSRALVLAARGWRHSNQTSKLREVVSRIASLSASVDPQYSSGDEVEAMLALVRILDIAGQTGAAIDAARATMARAFRIGSGNDPRIPLLGELIDTLIVLDQLSLAREAARKILEALAERDKDSPWWRHDRAIVARALGLVGMREQGLEIAQQLLAEARTAPVVLGAEEFYLPTIVETLGAPALDDLKVLWRDAARLPRMDQRARALTLLALSLHRIRKQDDALECLRQAFESERRAGNSSTLQMLGWTAPILAQHDGGVLLREIHERFCRFRDVLAPRR